MESVQKLMRKLDRSLNALKSLLETLQTSNLICEKVFMNVPSKICGRQPLKNFETSNLKLLSVNLCLKGICFDNLLKSRKKMRYF